MDKIVQKIRIPVEYVEVEVNTTKEALSKITSRLIMDDDFRVQFNKDPNKIFQEAGIKLDKSLIEKLEKSPITSLVKDMTPMSKVAAVPIAWVVVLVVVASIPHD